MTIARKFQREYINTTQDFYRQNCISASANKIRAIELAEKGKRKYLLEMEMKNETNLLLTFI